VTDRPLEINKQMQIDQSISDRISTDDLTSKSTMSGFGLPLPGPQPVPRDGEPPAFGFAVFLIAPLAGVEAVTDRGRSIPLFHYEPAALPLRGRELALTTDADHRELLCWGEQQYLANMRQDTSKLVRLLDPQPLANCHGWTFAGGRYGIEHSHIQDILADNGYSIVQQPQEADLAVYTSDGEVTHSGIVRIDSAGLLRVEGKLGPFSVFLHPAEAPPVAKGCTFYRSRRGGHALSIRPVAN
jgi:hypothetical protein